jgi:hypothetical protein
MKIVLWLVAVGLVLASCVQIVEEEAPKEVVYKPEVVNATRPVENFTVNKSVELPVNVSLSNVTNVTNATNTTNQFGTDAVWLSIGAQHKLIPELEELVKASECYQVTFENATEYTSQYGLEIKKELRFDYLGGLAFKGWILNKVVKKYDVLASDNFEVLVDDKEVICIDEPVPLQIDWKKVLSRIRT